jgi:ribose transport system ATP-binding protein
VASERPPIVTVERVSKRFGQTEALADVNLQLRAGQVHVLAGENGAGKSTLIRILSGVYGDYQGRVLLDGQLVRFGGPQAAARAGIATIHQELALVGPMSVTDNLLLGEPGGMFDLLRVGSRRARAERMLALLELDVDPDASVEALSLSVRQSLEIARALAQNARVFVMDEPSSALSEPEAERLFEQVLALRADGKAVVYITHRMEEIERLADHISVLRDGRVVASEPARLLGRDDLIEAMIGRRATRRAPPVERVERETRRLLEVKRLTVAGHSGQRRRLHDVSLSLERGEILGVAGQQGSGVATLVRALFGAVAHRGEMILDGAPFAPDPQRAVASGVVLLSGDRKLSLVQSLAVVDNVALSSLPRFSPLGWVRDTPVRAAVEALREKFGIDCPSLDAPSWQLSGGNQQKVALARCLLTEPKLLLVHEPTRGIDVGAKRDVYALLRELAADGVGIVLASSEADELIELCDRILVLARGSVTRRLTRREFSRSAILTAAMGDAA